MSQIEIRVRFNLMMKEGHHCFLMNVECWAEDMSWQKTPWRKNVMAEKRHGGKTPRWREMRRRGAKTPRRENATNEGRCPEKARPCLAQKTPEAAIKRHEWRQMSREGKAVYGAKTPRRKNATKAKCGVKLLLSPSPTHPRLPARLTAPARLPCLLGARGRGESLTRDSAGLLACNSIQQWRQSMQARKELIGWSSERVAWGRVHQSSIIGYLQKDSLWWVTLLTMLWLDCEKFAYCINFWLTFLYNAGLTTVFTIQAIIVRKAAMNTILQQ